MTETTFEGLGLAAPILRALAARGHDTPTPIQAQAIPLLLAGRDMMGVAQTGTGKTAAFSLPILHRLSRPGAPLGGAPRALILAPTRELAAQIGEEIGLCSRFLKLKRTVVFGGVKQGPQAKALSRGVDILVATPGRLLDLLNQRLVRLDAVEVLVLDEADRMLDMGFVRDVRKIIAAVPARRQSLLFSATMDAEVTRLAGDILSNPIRVEVSPQATPVDRIAQSVRHVAAQDKRDLLEEVLADPAVSRAIVFTRTKHRANRVAEQLGKAGIPADALHGNKSQGARQKALARFRSGGSRVLVATDIAARGIDVDGVTHVVNYELPNEPESYVHRIGRTARAGADGAAVAFCDPSERGYLRDIERLIRMKLAVVGDEPADSGAESAPGRSSKPSSRPSGGRRRRSGAKRAPRTAQGGRAAERA